MAGEVRRSHFQNCLSTIALDGFLTNSVQVKLVIEFLKDVMYQRQQIPMPHSQIAQCVYNEQKKLRGPLMAGHHLHPRERVEMRKRRLYIEHMSEVISTLEAAFAVASPIRRVLILMGSTILSPKECYTIHFPTSQSSGKLLSLSHCKAQLFRQLVASPFFIDVRQLKSCARVYVLLEMVEKCTHDLPIIPKPAFRLPKRGNHLTLHFIYPNNGTVEEWSGINDIELNISGVEPLNYSVTDAEMPSQRRISALGSGACPQLEDIKYSQHSTPYCQQQKERRNSCCPSELLSRSLPCRCESPMDVAHTPHCEGTDYSHCDIDQEGYTWYQLPLFIQGYKDKTTKLAGM